MTTPNPPAAVDDEVPQPIVTSAVGIAVLAEFEAQIDVISEKVLDDAIAAGYTDRSPDHRADASLHGLALCWGALQYARDGRVPDFSWFRQTLAERYRRGISTEDSIGVFRVGSRSMHRILCDMAMAHPDPEEAIAEITNAVYSLGHLAVLALTEARSELESDLAGTARRARTELTHALLSGARPPSSTSAQRRALRLTPPTGNYLVVVGSGPTEALALARFDEPATASALEEALGAEATCCVQRGEHVVALTPATHGSGEPLVDRLAAFAEYARIRLGIGRDSATTGSVAASYAEATLACGLCSADGSVASYDSISLLRHVARATAEAGLVPEPGWWAELRSEDNDALVTTLLALLDNNRVVAATADALGVHPNTVYSRLRQFERMSGLNPRRFGDLLELALHLEVDRSRR